MPRRVRQRDGTKQPVVGHADRSLQQRDRPALPRVHGEVEDRIVDATRQQVPVHSVPVSSLVDGGDGLTGEGADLSLRRRSAQDARQRADRDTEIGGATGVSRMIDVATLMDEDELQRPLEIGSGNGGSRDVRGCAASGRLGIEVKVIAA